MMNKQLCGDETDKIRALLSKAIALHTQKKYNKAEECYERVIRKKRRKNSDGDWDNLL